MTLLEKLLKKIDEKQDRMIEIRRHLHENPELSFEEYETSKYIEEFYKDVPIDDIQTNVSDELGHIVTIKGAGEGKTIALRADFDALPINEETDLDFKSNKEGVMHACGHDAHTAYMLILAESLAELKDQINGTIKILHQPAEEVSPGGALGMIKGGALEGVDHVFGAHVMSQFEDGYVYSHEGPTMTARGYFKLKIQGKGGHGSSPHACNDAIVAGSSFVMDVQQIVSRRLNPFDMGVVTIGNFDGKGSFNVIKDSVTIEGDTRSMSNESSDIIEREITNLAKGLEEGYGVKTELEYDNNYPVLNNDPEITRHVTELIKDSGIEDIKGVRDSGQVPPSEDFAYYLEEVPGSYIYVGAAPEGQDGSEAYPHHHPKFEINENAMKVAAKAISVIVDDYVG